MTAEAVQQLWIATLVIFLVVLAVVASLLVLILREARRITAVVSAIWNVGQRIANNTIHIALLHRTNHLVGRILASARGVAGAIGAVEAHARECTGCPACVIGPEWTR